MPPCLEDCYGTGWLIIWTVLLQAMKDEPAPDAKCKDKFLVQTVAVTKDMEFANVSSIVCVLDTSTWYFSN